MVEIVETEIGTGIGIGIETETLGMAEIEMVIGVGAAELMATTALEDGAHGVVDTEPSLFITQLQLFFEIYPA
jgi:hypothetical protein